MANSVKSIKIKGIYAVAFFTYLPGRRRDHGSNFEYFRISEIPKNLEEILDSAVTHPPH
jgi:hypothetical protein